MTAYEIVAKSRDKARPTALTYINNLIDGFIELHGDRKFADDKSIVGGVGFLNGTPVTVIGIEKGADTNSKVLRNFGCASPEGYRKALRLMRQAEKFRRPVICLVDTSGAYCGIGAEERGQAEAIADNIMQLFSLKTPLLSIIIGEGGSGGALGLAVADAVWMTETATYSVISPEGCASILYKDATKAAQAAEQLKITAQDLFGLGIVERVIGEQDFGEGYFADLKDSIYEFVTETSKVETSVLINKRYDRFRKFGSDF